eukprot:GEZU01021487.1.p2 GENE.GEZU01021487.1~~GEZU01021487.1.p2  ORF type:complete len:117 (-),score=22.08 GEZU01021487.1:302-652(-)
MGASRSHLQDGGIQVSTRDWSVCWDASMMLNNSLDERTAYSVLIYLNGVGERLRGGKPNFIEEPGTNSNNKHKPTASDLDRDQELLNRRNLKFVAQVEPEAGAVVVFSTTSCTKAR